MTGLARLGWDEKWAEAFGALDLPECIPGRVALEHNHVCRVLTAQGELLAETAGRVKHQASGRRELPAVGDWVAVRPDPRGGRALIRAVLPRRSLFSRKAAGRETDEQVVAANIDSVLLVFGLDKPVNQRSIERYLTVARRGGAEPIVVLNKVDLAEHPDEALASGRAAAGNVPVLLVSAERGTGLDQIAELAAPGRTIALLGPSGAGKSSLVNCLVGREVLPTGEVRSWDARGRHTSVHRQLVLREAGGLIIDTPGMREIQLWDTDTGLGETFEDVAALAADCRFRDCRHDREPGCAVKAAVAEGRLGGDRYESFMKLQREQEAVAERREERGLIEARRQGRIMGRAIKAMQKQRGR